MFRTRTAPLAFMLLICSSAFAAPGNPRKLTATALSDSEVKLTWTSRGGSTVGFYVNVRIGNRYPKAYCLPGGTLTNKLGLRYDADNQESIVISGLNPDQIYSFRVSSYDSDDNSSKGARTQVTTLTTPEIPSPPPGTLLQNLMDLSGDGSYDYLTDAKMDSQNGIVATGTIGSRINGYDQYDIGICRFRLDGSLDSDFGTDGLVRIDTVARWEYGCEIGFDSQNRIIVCGYSLNPETSKYEAVIVRLSGDGQLDSSFGLGGIEFYSPDPSEHCIVWNLAIAPDDSIFIGGRVGDSTTGDGLVAHLSASGVLLNSKVIDLGGYERINSLAFDSSGRLLAGGRTDIDGVPTSILARYVETDGQFELDLPYGVDGINVLSVASEGHWVRRLLLDSLTGNMYATGSTMNADGTAAIAIFRFTEEGELDPSFGSNGVTIADLGEGDDKGYAIAQDNEGRLLVAGRTFVNGNSDVAICRFKQDGLLDADFGAQGSGVLRVSPTEGDDYVRAIVHDPLTGIGYVFGRATPSNADSVIIAFDNGDAADTP